MTVGCVGSIITGGLAGLIVAIEHESGMNGVFPAGQFQSPYLDAVGLYAVYYMSKLVPSTPEPIIVPREPVKTNFLAEAAFEGVLITGAAVVTYAIARPLIHIAKSMHGYQ